jgi:large subunit ribosomal protein L30
MADQKIEISQVRSAAGRDKRTKNTLAAIGLGRIGAKQTLPKNPAVLGMIRKVSHLVEVKELS